MNGHQYEHRCAKYLKENGYTNITVTPGSGDQGIDIIAYKAGDKYGIQCKYYEGAVGNKAIQEAFAGSTFYDCTVAMVITNSTFTKSAIELAHKLGVILKDGVNAIVLQNSSRSTKAAVSPEDEKQVKLEQIERMLQEKYQALRAKYPENPAKDKEIDDYIQRAENRVDSLKSDFDAYIKLTSSHMQSYVDICSVKSLRDSRLTSYKDSMRAHVKWAGEKARKELEDADRYASSQLSAGISERSVNKLIGLMEHIYNNREFSVSINNQVIAKIGWTAKHTRIIEKWRALRQELPSAIENRDRKAEEQETHQLHEKLDNTKVRIVQVQKEIKELQASIPARECNLISFRKELAQILAKQNSLQQEIDNNERAKNVERSPLEQKLTDIMSQCEQLTKQEDSLSQSLDNLHLFDFKRKKVLKAEIDGIRKRIEALSAQQSDLSSQHQTITAKYNHIIHQLKTEYDTLTLSKQQLQTKISQIERDIRKRTTEARIDRKEHELEGLRKALSRYEESLKSAHKDYLLRHYSDFTSV